MPMDSTRFEEIMEKLNNPELELPEKSELLQELRNDHTKTWEEHNTNTAENSKLKKEKEDLLLTNSRYFNQLSTLNNNEEQSQEEQQQTLSESITIDDFGK